MQRRDVLALHIASDPGLALDIMVFTLADADTHDWRARAATTLRGPAPSGPIIGFEAKDAPASGALAELRSGLDESWRAGDNTTARFDLFRALSDDSRAAWLGFVVARSLEASLNMTGDRQMAYQDHLGSLVGIDMAQWWRPTAANYFDRVSKQAILDALTDVGGLELSSRFASVKKGDLAMSAERIFAGTYITEVEVREKALSWVPEVMRFAAATQDPAAAELDGADIDSGKDDQDPSPRELAA
jgi:ParB family chromosome partitioning protein